MESKVGLIILDGWGVGDKSLADAVHAANTPFMDDLLKTRPHSLLLASEESVGLPKGQMGNSEVGHLNLGAGRIVYQELSRINNSISSGEFFNHPVLLEGIQYAKQHQKKIHLLGLVSHGGVHSSFDHLKALIDLCKSQEASKVFIHAITDGRDCNPTTAVRDLEALLELCNQDLRIATVIGRYFAMDRDQRWARIKKAYDLFVHGRGIKTKELIESIRDSYSQEVFDEFIEPLLVDPEGLIEAGDVVISFNFRTDRPRQITQALTQTPFPEWEMKPLDLYFITMTRYDETYKEVKVVFDKDHLENTLGETVSNAGKTQLRIAETEKYPHVTFFFSGGREEPYPGEQRILVKSPSVPTYDLAPEMSSSELSTRLIAYIDEYTPDFFCMNYASPDMVGHTGVYSAIVKAVESVDSELNRIVKHLTQRGYELIVLADHGNAEKAINSDGSPNTSHTLNPVPCIYIGHRNLSLKNGILADVAPTLLELLGINKPDPMTGISLIW